MPIRHKLTLAIMLTSCLALVLAGVFIIGYEWSSYRVRMSRDLGTLARVVGDQCAAALNFDDTKAATETLAALKGNPSILAAAIYNKDGHRFAAYTHNQSAADLPAAPGTIGTQFTEGYLQLTAPIEQDGLQLGTLYVRESLDDMRSQLTRYGEIVALAVGLLMLLTLGLSTAIQHAISDPVVALASAARLVSEKQDYSVRVEGKGEDEIGQLIKTFNQMLLRIDESDLALRGINETLHEEVDERKRTEESLRVSEANFHALLNNAIVGVYIVQRDRFVLVNQRLAEIYGYSQEEMLAMGPSLDLVFSEDREMVEEIFRRRSGERATAGEAVGISGVFRGQRKDGRVIYVEGHTSEVEIEGQPAIIGLLLDVTARKQSEVELHRLLTNARCILWRAWVSEGIPGEPLRWRYMLPDEQAAQRVVPLEKPKGCDYMALWRNSIELEDRLRVDEATARALVGGESNIAQEFRCIDRDGQLHWMHEDLTVKAVGPGSWDVFGVCTDITASKAAEQELRVSEGRLREVLQRARCILWSGDVTGLPGWEENPESPQSFEWHLTIHEEQAAGSVLPLEVPEGSDFQTVLAECRFSPPGAREAQDGVALPALVSGAEGYAQEFACPTNGRLHWLREDVSIQRVSHGQWQVFGVITDVSERKVAEARLEEYVQKLERSNRELQDFAYVSSHDLQEPLRAIQNFSERLRTKHGESMNDEALDYLMRMQNAAGRMRTLIQDLLLYSRVTTKAKPFQPTKLQQVAETVMADLAARLEDTGGRVEVGELPVIDADSTQMRQLLQNFIGNALKFHRPEAPPVVRVYQTEPEKAPAVPSICFAVSDNGIGFDQKYSEKIFTPFQRLHGQGKYEGTGIGLAICRKIVERHGGNIEVRSVPGEGTTFFVTLPIHQEKPPSEG